MKFKKEEELAALFNLRDVNRDGYLDGHELRFIFVESFPSMPLVELDKAVDHVLEEDDKNNDGKISFAEYIASQKKHGEV
ncbi:hypothetical protein ROZALSC1DRAFT_31104 [Rozella allomycis CSF55]|uniref:EF-Hand 1, calcium-binding site domain-containing protein n=1 Tax=Rozella allomycis (strain CSF55) TaxID=988480 RepID=A0A075B4N7_ROZAC|nr:EF-Hand 1, calcium-binding site domain-containing protein [Rozella allomycis CSF55]RKP17049.1 hypothetical protein ROZALSC1DRAFT_31104 [Rozella allomycis CSF55]|eukprot:EPZ36498.1 EF-Hand 1, calcium-binding site domain-containing protein [Rozella allomycis CSF55]